MKKGISLISLIITIIVIIILAAIVIFIGLNTPDRANFAKYVQEVSDVRTAILQEYANMKTQYAIENKTRSDAQIYYTMATGNEIDMNDDTSTLKAGTIEELGITTVPDKLFGNEFYEVTDNEKISGWPNNKGYYEPLGTEKHYITDKGEFFILPGYRVVEGNTTKWYVNESKYYVSNEPIRNNYVEKIAIIQGKEFWQGGNLAKAYNGSIFANITGIIKSSTKPTDDIINDSNHLWSTSDSENKVYFWVDSNVMYWWSEANHIMLNEDCSTLFVAWNNLSNISGLSDFDASQVKDMYAMFMNCSKINDFSPIANWNVENVENMMTLFNNTGMSSIDLSRWRTSKVKNMGGMFGNNNNLTTIYASESFTTNSVTEQTDTVFVNVPQLEGGSGTKYDSSKEGVDMAHIDGGTSNPGYFTSK